MSESKGRKAVMLMGSVLFLAGLGILLYPYTYREVVSRKMESQVEQFFSRTKATSCETEAAAVDFSAVEGPEETLPERYPELWLDMQDYNQTIFREGQTGLSSPAAYAVPNFCLGDYGLESEVFGVLSIPALGLEMPLYLGASAEHMAAGAAILTQTSLPIGGSNTNSVIAGHRGWNGAAYFLYLDRLKPGDEVIVTNLWQELHYAVVETQIIAPNDLDAVKIQEGRELLTLLTCHPPASGGKQRYLVFCERVL